MARVCALVLTLTLLQACAHAQEDRIGVADEFSTVDGWACNNRNAPGTLECDGTHLILTDLPGGKAQWGTSCAKTFRNVDVSKYRYLVVKLDEMTKGFGAKVTSPGKEGKHGVLQGAEEPGLVVEDIVRTTKWRGVIDINVGLYAQGPESRIKVDYLRFVSSLTPKERLAMRKTEPLEAVPLCGLEQLSRRKGTLAQRTEPPYPSERFIYMDPATHAWVWRMTADPSIERHEYYDIPAWNADGSLLIFLSRRGGSRYWLMDADGSSIRPFPTPADGSPGGKPFWAFHDPDRAFFSRSDEARTDVMAMIVRTGEVQEVVSIPVPGLGMEPPHPDDKHFLLRRGNTHLWVVDGDTGKFTDFETFPTHRRRFTKAPDFSIFINRDFDPEKPDVRKRTSWVCDRSGGSLWMIDDQKSGHPDWSPDGSTHSAYGRGGITLVDRDGTNRRLAVKTAGGHGGWSFDGEWLVSDSPGGGPYRNLVFVAKADGTRVHPICFHLSSYSGWSSGVPDPEATHPAPICSPDGTKIVYDSDMLGQPDMWVALWQFPAKPEEVQAHVGKQNTTLTWKRPARSKELAGYNVYRKGVRESEFRRIATRLQDPQFVDETAKGKGYDYGVSCQEHSGYESPMATAWHGRTVRIIEVEEGTAGNEGEIVLDQRTGNGFYVSAKMAKEPRTMEIDVGSPDAGKMTLWARIRDPQDMKPTWTAAVNGATASSDTAGKAWAWRKLDKPLALQPKAKIRVTLSPGIEMDQLVATDDAALTPSGVMGRPNAAPAAPTGLKADADATHTKLSWQPVEGAHHYCVYATREPEMERGNKTLVGTPSQPSFADCGLVPDSIYRYQVTAMDIWGNESEPTETATAETKSKDWVYLHLDAGDATLEAPMVLAPDKACSGKGYLHVPDSHSNAKYVYDGAAHLTLSVPAEDDYFLWGRAMGLDGKSDSFFLAMDDGEKQQWSVGAGKKAKPGWRWLQPPGFTPIHLSAGKHTLHVHSREDGARLDQMIVTNDPMFQPAGLQPRMKRGELLYANDFADEKSVDGWKSEGAVRQEIRDGSLWMEAFDKGATKGVFWCPEVFEDPIEVTWRFRPLTDHGLCIIFFMAEGRQGEDIFTWERDGAFQHYIKGKMNAYHISYHRDFTDMCNIRKNYGFHLVAEALDPCRTKDREYEISVRKLGGHVQFIVDGRLVHNWLDDGTAGGPPHNRGKIGLRHTRKMQALYDDLRVYRLKAE